MATTKAGQRAVAKYMKNNDDEVKLRIKKGQKTLIQGIAAQQGQSLNGYIKNAVETKIKADTGTDTEL